MYLGETGSYINGTNINFCVEVHFHVFGGDWELYQWDKHKFLRGGTYIYPVHDEVLFMAG